MIIVHDNLLPEASIETIRESALESGFGTWSPPTHKFGSGVYKGMNYKGSHAPIHILISKIMGRPIYPNQSFFRVFLEDEEKRLIHSDRSEGGFTAITYLSDHKEISGTSFYKHIPTGMTDMPAESDLEKTMSLDEWNKAMQDDSQWETTDFVRGLMGRIMIFSAPLFHGRVPDQGIGTTPEDGRMIHVCHFES